MTPLYRIWLAAIVSLPMMAVWVAAEEKVPSAGAMDPAMQQAMKYMSVGENHKVLQPLVGQWSVKVTGWMKPGAKPEISQGTSNASWALNGRFVKEEFKGTWGGQPFEGVSYTGYDNVRALYQTTWMDSMGTGIMFGEGAYNSTKKTIETSGTFGCPITGDKAHWFRSELKIENPDKRIYNSYGKGPDGKEFKGMEIVYTRMK